MRAPSGGSRPRSPRRSIAQLLVELLLEVGGPRALVLEGGVLAVQRLDAHTEGAGVEDLLLVLLPVRVERQGLLRLVEVLLDDGGAVDLASAALDLVLHAPDLV